MIVALIAAGAGLIAGFYLGRKTTVLPSVVSADTSAKWSKTQ